MFFANFKDLTIKKEYHYTTYPIGLPIYNGMPLKEMDAVIQKELQKLDIEQTQNPVFYVVELMDTSQTLEKLPFEELVDTLLTVATLVNSSLLKMLETGEGYKRERRLDVPDKLKPIHASYSILKRAVNNKLKTPYLNIKVMFNDVAYWFCDSNKMDKEGENQ